MAGKGSQPDKWRQGIVRSFDHAFQGLIHAVRTQRNMRFHVAAALLVLAVSVAAGVSLLELALLVLVVSFVLVVEMLNTAIEYAVDLVTGEYHPLAKLSKDVSAGAVLVSSIGAVLVGVLILADDAWALLFGLQDARRGPVVITVGVLGAVALLVVAIKALAGPGGTPFAALPSGPAALAFAGWVAVSFVAVGSPYGALVSLLTLLLALLVCLSSVEGRAGDLRGVVSGAVVGSVVTFAAFQLL